MSLKPGDAGKAKISVSGKGLNLAMPTLPLTTPVKVQVIRSGASTCWEATFTTPAVNQSDRFTGKSD